MGGHAARLFGASLVIKAFVPVMTAKHRSRIINLASLARRPMPMLSAAGAANQRGLGLAPPERAFDAFG